jgi:diguanylate cyclase (GGDEF)-like protein/PAS domain S-box-containing protein
MIELQEVTEKIYLHPYTVSNAARTINSHFNKMQHDVTAAVLEDDEDKIELLFNEAMLHSEQGLRAFDIIFQRYLGDSTDVQNAHEAFLQWRVIRQEVRILLRQGRKNAAIKLLQDSGQLQAMEVSSAMQKLIDYTEKKALEFRTEAIEKKENTLILIGILLTFVVAGSLLIGIFIVRKVFIAQNELKHHLHIIDQNVCSFDLDKNGVITKVSNALCRLLKSSMDDILNKELPEIVNDDISRSLIRSGLQYAQTGEPWDGDEISHHLNNDDIIWIELSLTPVFDDDYEVKGFSGVVSDASDKHMVGELAITDKLTGIYNRRHFDTIFSKEIKIARRNNKYLTLAIVDIDFFKNFNDYYGHQSGDQVLNSVATILGEFANRPDDYLFRIGGEEFAMIFSGLTPGQAHEHLENKRKAVEAAGIEHKDSKVSGNVTISIGYWTAKIDGDITETDIYHFADQALYVAKTKRNKCLSYSDNIANISIINR